MGYDPEPQTEKGYISLGMSRRMSKRISFFELTNDRWVREKDIPMYPFSFFGSIYSRRWTITLFGPDSTFVELTYSVFFLTSSFIILEYIEKVEHFSMHACKLINAKKRSLTNLDFILSQGNKINPMAYKHLKYI